MHGSVRALLSMGLGVGGWQYGGGWARQQDVRVREGFAIVALAWFLLVLVGGLPFVFGGVLESFTDAFFERSPHSEQRGLKMPDFYRIVIFKSQKYEMYGP